MKAVIKILGGDSGRLAFALVALLANSSCSAKSTIVSPQDGQSPLRLERKIALPRVAGRIDHLALDALHDRLFVAEYGNGTVDAVDVKAGQVTGRIAGLKEPQGIGVSADGAEIVVACGDGTVHFYATAGLREITRLSLGDDADDVRMDLRNGHALIGYGNGGLAVIDMATHQVLRRMTLNGHPEGFSLSGPRVFINIPDRGVIVAGDIDSGQTDAFWQTGLHRLNFPMAIDSTGQRLAVAYRFPAALQLRQADGGAVLSNFSACGDADDVFFDGDRALVVCGSGYVDVRSLAHPEQGAERVTTSPGARTGLFVPEQQTLFVAAPKRDQEAAIWVLRVAQ